MTKESKLERREKKMGKENVFPAEKRKRENEKH